MEEGNREGAASVGKEISSGGLRKLGKLLKLGTCLCWLSWSPPKNTCWGRSIGREINDLELSVHNVGGAFFAIGDICTHAFARLSFGLINDSVITCPLHQAKFDIRTGKVLEGPADEDLDSYPVKVEGEKLYVGVPDR